MKAQFKIGDIVWFQDPSYRNPYGKQDPPKLAIIHQVSLYGDERYGYHFTIIETGNKQWAWETDLKAANL